MKARVMQVAEHESHTRAEQLRLAARDLFLEHGFDATSMDSIARAAGVSKRTPYIYYESKHDLFSAVTLAFMQDLDARLNAIWTSTATGLDALKNAARAYAEYALEDHARFELIMTFERRDFYPNRDEALATNAQACQDANDRVTAKLYAAINRAKAEGSLQTEMNARQYGLLLWSSLAGVISIAVQRRAILPKVYKWSPEALIEAFIEHFFRTGIE